MTSKPFATHSRALRLILVGAGLAALLAIAARLVRADAPADRYVVDAAQMTVTDMRTGLVWQQTISTSYYTLADASAYCVGIRSGFTSAGFRLPTFKELMTLLDPTRNNPPVYVKAFPNTPAEWFWTASDRNPMGVAAVSFMSGETGFFAASDSLRVRCVR